MTTRKQLSELYDFTVENIDRDLQRKRLTAKEAQVAKQAAFNEYQDYLAEFEGVATLDREEIIAGNSFGQELVDIADEYGWDLQDLSEVLGVDPDEIEDLIISEDEPEEEIVDQVAEIFESLGEEDEEELEDDEEEVEEEEEEDEETQEAPYKATYKTANFSNYESRKIKALEEKLNQMEREKEVIAAFSERQSFAANLVNNGDMPPAVYNYLFGSLDGGDNLAQFSEFCQENQVDVVSRFHALDTVLDVFSQMGLGESGLFMAYSDQVEEAEFSSQEDAAERQARANYLGNLKANGLDK